MGKFIESKSRNDELPSDLKLYYFEILFSINVSDSCKSEIISEIISDEISKCGEGVEFINDNIEIIE